MIFVVPLVALIVSLAALPPLIALLRRLGALDVPTQRSSHLRSTPRGGGAAVVVATVAAVFAGLSWTSVDLLALGPALVALGGLGVLGLREDLRGVPAMRRLAWQVAIGTAVAGVLLALGHPVWIAALAIAAVVAYANVFNFMDGVNAISGVNAAFAGVVYAIIGAQHDAPAILVVGLAVAGASMGFLPFNAPVARVFLGDSGSYALGGVLAVLAVECLAAGASLILCVAPMILYLADTGTTLVDRLRRGQSCLAAHRDHAYQALAGTPLGHLGAALVTLVGAATMTGFALMIELNWNHLGLAAPTAGMILLGYLGVPRLLRSARPGVPASASTLVSVRDRSQVSW